MTKLNKQMADLVNAEVERRNKDIPQLNTKNVNMNKSGKNFDQLKPDAPAIVADPKGEADEKTEVKNIDEKNEEVKNPIQEEEKQVDFN